MPIYGEEKKREIARSILPCTKRERFRKEFQAIKQNGRRAVKVELGCITKGYAEDTIENYDESAYDFESYPDHEIIQTMWNRRDHDKLGAVLRWAPKQVEGVRKLDRVSKMYQIMPDNLIGRHAVSHIENLDEFYVPDVYSWRWNKNNDWTAAEKAWVAACNYAVVDARLRKVLERKDALTRFNKEINIDKWVEISAEEYDVAKAKYGRNSLHLYGYRGYRGYSKRISVHRPLLGAHDIEAFVKEVGRAYVGGYYSSEGKAMEKGFEAAGV